MKWWRRHRGKSRPVIRKDEMRNQSNGELMHKIERILEAGNDETMDADRLEAYLAELQERAPVMEDYDAAAEWEKTKEEHAFLFELEESGPSGRSGIWSGFQKIRAAEIIIATALCLVITANAFGHNPARWFLDWVDGIIRISNAEPSGSMILPQDDGSEYHSLSEALDAYDINSDTGPQWIPADYALSSVVVQESDDILRIEGFYVGERGRLLIRVTQYNEESSWVGYVERDEGGTECTINNHQIYYVTNAEKAKAGWLVEQCFYEIIGQVTEDEITQMIQSIQ